MPGIPGLVPGRLSRAVARAGCAPGRGLSPDPGRSAAFSASPGRPPAAWLCAAGRRDPLLPGRGLAPGRLYRIAGDGSGGNAGDGHPAPRDELDWPFGAAIDAKGNLYVRGAIERWNGRRWSTVSWPRPAGARLLAVAVARHRSAWTAWAAGVTGSSANLIVARCG